MLRYCRVNLDDRRHIEVIAKLYSRVKAIYEVASSEVHAVGTKGGCLNSSNRIV